MVTIIACCVVVGPASMGDCGEGLSMAYLVILSLCLEKRVEDRLLIAVRRDIADPLLAVHLGIILELHK